MLLIRKTPPVKGERERICRTGEATISRIHVPGMPYDGMVERLQKIPKGGKRRVGHFACGLAFPASSTSGYLMNDANAHYHILKFLALGAARLLFPRNLVNAPELRVFERRGSRYAATYSDFVPDESGVIERLGAARRRFYGAGAGRRDEVGREVDAEERRRNPQLEPLIEKIEMKGTFLLAHPEANYHLAYGNTVFFEVQGINVAEVLLLGQRLNAYPETSRTGAGLLDITAAIHATLIHQWVNLEKRGWSKAWAELDFDTLRDMLLRVYTRTDTDGKASLLGLSMVEKVTKMLRHPPDFWFGPGFIGPLEKPSVDMESAVSDFL